MPLQTALQPLPLTFVFPLPPSLSLRSPQPTTCTVFSTPLPQSSSWTPTRKLKLVSRPLLLPPPLSAPSPALPLVVTTAMRHGRSATVSRHGNNSSSRSRRTSSRPHQQHTTTISSSSSRSSAPGRRPPSSSSTRPRRQRLAVSSGDDKNAAAAVEGAVDINLGADERLHKVLARLGVASRRQAEAWMTAGRVCVNGHIASEAGTTVNVWRDKIQVDGTDISTPSPTTAAVWLAIHKPRGYLSTMTSLSPATSKRHRQQQQHPISAATTRGGTDNNSEIADADGAKCKADKASLLRLLRDSSPRLRLPRSVSLESLVAAGVIEEDASGLVLVTNERGAIPPLVKPCNAHVQTWYVDVLDVPSVTQLRKLNGDVVLHDGGERVDARSNTHANRKRNITSSRNSSSSAPVRPVTSIVCSGRGDITRDQRGLMSRLEIRVRDSRHRVVRRVCEAAGLTVLRMSRRSFGPVLLGSLRSGGHRFLRPKEVKALKRGVSERTVKSWT